MTPDEIERAAIEAAAKEAIITAVKLAGGDTSAFESSWGKEKPEDKDKLLTCVRAAIAAYNAAKWTSEGPKDGTKTLAFNKVTGTYVTAFRAGEWPMRSIDMDGIWYPKPTLFCALPQPPASEVK